MKTSFAPARLIAAILLAALGLLSGCATIFQRGPTPPLLLISLDAFRWDYCALHPEQTPHLRQLMREGISARQLVPVFPSNTFPNHYSIVTGLYPSHHGIINNEFFDPSLGEVFHYNQAASVMKPQWWGGEPIWVTANKQGRKSASSYWVGSEAEIGGFRPNFWKVYDPKLSFEDRFNELIGWFHLPEAQRPAVITFYIEETNSIGHKYGPDSPELIAAIKLIDDRVGAIVDRLKADGIVANIVIVSDHGMTPISLERVIPLDDFVAATAVQIDFDGPVAGLRPLDGDVPALLRALSAMPHVKISPPENLPARFHISANPRNPPVWIVPDEGWEIYSRGRINTYREKFNKGDHGFDNALDSMRGILIAQGPAFKTGGRVIDPVENIQLYNALCAALHLKPAPNDGDRRLVRALLR